MIYLLSIIIVVIISLFFVKVSFTFNFSYHMKDHAIITSVFWKKRCLYRKKTVLSDNETRFLKELFIDPNHNYSISMSLKKKLGYFKNVISLVINYSSFTQLKWETTLGIRNASHTAVFTGIMWMVKGSVLGLLDSKGTVACEPILLIHPLFNEHHFETKIHCILSMKLWHTIYCIFKLKTSMSARR